MPDPDEILQAEDSEETESPAPEPVGEDAEPDNQPGADIEIEDTQPGGEDRYSEVMQWRQQINQRLENLENRHKPKAPKAEPPAEPPAPPLTKRQQLKARRLRHLKLP